MSGSCRTDRIDNKERVLNLRQTVLAGLINLFILAGAGLPSAAADQHTLLPSFRTMLEPEAEPSLAEPIPPVEVMEAAGARVGRIIIKAQNIFDTSRDDEDTLLFGLANSLHIRTRDDTIRDRLLFRSGDAYSQRLLDESERILRDTRFLYDADVRPVAYADGVVDIEVRTRDTWTLNPGLNFGRSGGENSFGFKLEERNLLGYGSRIVLEYSSDVDRDTNLIAFSDPNLGRSWWDLGVELQDNSDGQRQALSLQRPFFELDARWSAGFNYINDERIESIFIRGVATDRYRLHGESVKFWRGWSAGLTDGYAHRWRLGYSHTNTDYSPLASTIDPTLVPGDSLVSYPWLGYEFVEDRFYETRNRDQIARTEDFSRGWRLNAELGLSQTDWGSDVDALLIFANLAKGHDFDPDRTIQTGAGLDGQLEADELVDTLFSGFVRYYQRQSPRRLFYAALAADSGIELDPNEQLLLGGDNGLRGYPLRFAGGHGRWLLTLEQRFFSTWYPYRLFHVGGAIFFDAGGVWGSSLSAEPNPGILRDVGFGFRLGNSRSGLGNVLHLDFAFPLDGGDGIDEFQFLVSTKSSF